MAVSTKTPGVYVDEISTLPASVAEVATAVPAFIGYTQIAIKNNVSLSGIPTRITSLLEYEKYFGKPYNETLEIGLSNPEAGKTTPRITVTPKTSASLPSPFVLYYQVQMYFENGGGPCYIVSVGATYNAVVSPSASNILKADLLAGIAVCEQEDEITLLCVPETTFLSAGIKDVYDSMLAQCAKLQDRFAILDAVVTSGNTIFQDAAQFRNSYVGSDNLKYGTSYYPQVQSTLGYAYNLSTVKIKTDTRTSASTATKGPYNNVLLSKVIDGTTAATKADAKITINDAAAASHIISVGGYSFALTGANVTAIATALKDAINTSPDLTGLVTAASAAGVVTVTATTAGSAGNEITMGYNSLGNAPQVALTSTTLVGGYDSVDMPLYNAIVSAMNNFNVALYPCGAIAGVYARVDRERGVWKAPANVDVRRVDKPLISISDEDQEGLNIDASTGKSINAIRFFQGKGNKIWGARTLAGNDNEWRYVPVRRFYIMVEESVKKATEFVVFEPNDANTWNRVKTMIENYLTNLWRQGALAGAKPADAFFVKIGLGQTMTADDILNGIMNIEIGMAAVRPAEFIVLKFSHKLAVS